MEEGEWIDNKKLVETIFEMYNAQKKEEEHWLATREELGQFHQSELDEIISKFNLSIRKESSTILASESDRQSGQKPRDQRLIELRESFIQNVKKAVERHKLELDDFDAQIGKRWLQIGSSQLQRLREAGFSRAIFCKALDFDPDDKEIRDMAEDINFIHDQLSRQMEREKLSRHAVAEKGPKKKLSPIPPPPPT